jgi:hypothetical protein
MPTRGEIDLLVDANQKIRTLATTAVRRQWRNLPTITRDNLDAVRDVIVATNQATVATFGQASAVVAADHYELTREAAGVRSRFTPLLADLPDPDAVASATRWALTPLYDDLDADAALGRVEGVVDRLALSPSNDTILRNTLADPEKPRFARIPNGRTCEWCRMLASRGAVYRTEGTAMAPRHAKCDCTVHAVWSDADLPDDYNLGGLQDEYYRARAAAGSGKVEDILAEMRKGAAAREAAEALEREAAAKAAKVARRAANKAAKASSIEGVAARYDVDVDEVRVATGELKILRKRIADEAARDQYEALGILERADAVKLKRPPRAGVKGSGDYDWLERIGAGERARLSRSWYTETSATSSKASSVDNIADALRRDLGGELVNMSDDQIIADVWVPLTRRVEGSGAVRRGKLPSDRAYGGRVDVDRFAPGVGSDGYDVRVLLGDDLEAAGHIARVNRNAYADDAYRALGQSATPTHGPAPFDMSFQAWETEVRTLEEGLEGLNDMAVTAAEARARLAELIPGDLDGPGFSYEDVYAAIVTTARQAALDVPARAVIPWAI